MLTILTAIKDIVLNVLGAPNLLYRVEFTLGGPHVTHTKIGYPTWVVGMTEVPGQSPLPAQSPLSQVTGELLRLRITYPDSVSQGSTAAVQCLIPLPSSLRLFTMKAQFEWLFFRDSPNNPGDQWAALLVATNANRLEEIDRSGTTTEVIGATHQFRTDGTGLMAQLGLARGVGDAATPGVRVPIDQVYPASGGTGADRRFLLETDIDTMAGRGWSRLRGPAWAWAERAFSHTLSSPNPNAPTGLTGVGVGLAIANGVGTAHMEVRDFAIYSWDWMVPVWRPAALWLARFR